MCLASSPSPPPPPAPSPPAPPVPEKTALKIEDSELLQAKKKKPRLSLRVENLRQDLSLPNIPQ